MNPNFSEIKKNMTLRQKVEASLDYYLSHPKKVRFLAHREIVADITGNHSSKITEQDTVVAFELAQAILNKAKEQPEIISHIDKMFFRGSPNLLELLTLEDSIIVAAQYSRTPALQGHIAMGVVGELVYNISFCIGDLVGSLLETIKKQDISTQLDIVDLLKTVAADAVANGEWAEPAYEKVKDVLTRLRESTPYPIVRIASEASLGRILKEWDDPSLSFLKYSNDKSNSRLRERRPQSDEIFMFPHDDKIGVIEKRLHPIRIAKDAIAYVDHSNTALGIARRERKAVSPEEYEAGFLQALAELVGHNEVQDIFDLILNYASLYRDLKSREEVSKEIADIINTSWEDVLSLINLSDLFDQKLSRREAEEASIRFEDLLQKLPAQSNSLLRRYIQTRCNGLLASGIELTTIYPYSAVASDSLFGIPTKETTSTLLLSHLHKPEMLHRVSNLLGVQVADMSIRAQVRLLNVLSKFGQKDIDRLTNVLGRFEGKIKLDYLNMFIALAANPESLEDILYIGESVSVKDCRRVFSLFAKLSDTSDVMTDQFKNTARKFNLDTEASMSDRVQIRVAAKMGKYIKDVSSALRADIPLDVVLSQVETESSLFFSFYSQVVRSGGEKELRELPDCTVSEVSGDKVSESDRKAMESLYTYNYRDNPEEGKSLISKLLRDLNSSSKVYILHHFQTLVAFIRFTEQPDGSLFVGSLNVKPYEQQDSIGIALLEQTLAKESKNRVVVADCEAHKFVTPRYIELGFVGTDTFVEFGKEIMNIKIDKQLDSVLTTKKLTPKELLDFSTNHELTVQDVDDLQTTSFDSLKDGFVLSRCIKTDSGYRFVFERPSI